MEPTRESVKAEVTPTSKQNDFDRGRGGRQGGREKEGACFCFCFWQQTALSVVFHSQPRMETNEGEVNG